MAENVHQVEKENETDDVTPQLAEYDLNEFISPQGKENSKFDERTKLVFDNLREKLVTNPSEKKSIIEIQLEKSEKHLDELVEFGNELVNNIKSINEQREVKQFQEKRKKEIVLKEKIRKEAEASLKEFEKINKKWKRIGELNEPVAIYEKLEAQRMDIALLMASKDKIIGQCQEELNTINNKYYEDRDKQSEDIYTLVKRVDHQIKLLKKSYRSNIYELESTIETEKQKLLNESQDAWNNLYEHLTTKEDQRMQLVKEKQEYYASELANICSKQEEITRNTKIRLEKDAEALELEIRRTQANILMNSEKIDYNYQVLQKRNEENIIINNQQKRRVGKLNETIVALKKKLVRVKEQNKQAVEKITLDIQKLHASINDLQTKSDYFRKNNINKLTKVWNINFQDIKNLMTRVFEIDRVLYEQQLGRKWIPPDIDLDKLDVIKELQAYNKAAQTGAKQHKQLNKHISESAIQKHVHDILHKISDRAGFLVEGRLLQILEPYTDNDKCVVKIESIFAALNITNSKMVDNLIKYFEPYSWCPNCSSGVAKSTLSHLYSSKRQMHTADETPPDSTDIVCTNHTPLMEPTLVLTALNEFIDNEVNTVKSSKVRRASHKDVQNDALPFDKAHIISYWKQFGSFMSQDQQKVWKSIEHGLNHYLDVLKKRAQIDSECVFLEKQNAELKHLLHKL